MKKISTLLAVLLAGSMYGQSSLKLSYQYKKSDVTRNNGTRIDSLVKAMEAESPGMDYIIVGHADSIGGPEYNDSLSLVRAEKIKDHFIKLGIKEENLSIKALGLKEPLMPNDTEEGRDKNRRVEIFFEDLNKLAAQKFELLTDDTTAILTNSGCRFAIDAKDLVTEEGEAVEDTITVFIKEYNTPVDFLVGDIPMENKQKRIFYDSYSMFDIRVFNDSIPLVLKEGASYSVECPIRDTDKQINLYEFNQYKGEWDDLSNIRNVAKNKAEAFVAMAPMNEDPSSTLTAAEAQAIAAAKAKSKTEPAKYLTQVKLNTEEKDSQRKLALAKWKLLEDVRKKGSPSCVDTSGNCSSAGNIAQLIAHEYDSVWYGPKNDTLKAKGIDISYRMNKYFKSAVFTVTLSEKFFLGHQYTNGMEWRHKIKGMSKEEFDERMNKQWTDVKFYGAENSTKEFRMVLKHAKGAEELILKKRYFKEGYFEGVKETEAEVYSEKKYADDYCFWKENWKYMPDAELRMPFDVWMRKAAANQDELKKKYAYLATKGDSLDNVWCGLSEDSKQDVQPVQNGKVDLFGFSLINFDAEISTREYLSMALTFESNGNEVVADTVYQVMKGLNSLRTFVPVKSTDQFKILKDNDTYFYVLGKDGKRYLSSIERFSEDKGAVVKLRDVTAATSTEKGLRKELSLNFPSKEWILADKSEL